MFKIGYGGFSTLYSFTGGVDGANPMARLVQGSDGYLYGTTEGGRRGGTVFRISTNGGLTIVHFFTNAADGVGPNDLVQGSDGSFYGTTEWGGANNDGTVFKISSNGALTRMALR